MPDLPTFTVTNAQATRALAAFGSTFQYKVWLADSVRKYVRTVERQNLKSTMEADLASGLDEIDSTDPLEGV